MIERYAVLCSEVAGELDMVGQKSAAQHLTDLVGHFIATSTAKNDSRETGGLAAARLDLMKADILKHLDRADLTVEAVAAANGMSGRQAQRMFAAAGTTFTEFVLEQRLMLARRLLLHETARGRKVSDIAFRAGFNDLSYFHRAFKKRFGATPAEIAPIH
jgi:AraC-like DNA-binding protein